MLGLLFENIHVNVHVLMLLGYSFLFLHMLPANTVRPYFVHNWTLHKALDPVLIGPFRASVILFFLSASIKHTQCMFQNWFLWPMPYSEQMLIDIVAWLCQMAAYVPSVSCHLAVVASYEPGVRTLVCFVTASMFVFYEMYVKFMSALFNCHIESDTSSTVGFVLLLFHVAVRRSLPSGQRLVNVVLSPNHWWWRTASTGKGSQCVANAYVRRLKKVPSMMSKLRRWRKVCWASSRQFQELEDYYCACWHFQSYAKHRVAQSSTYVH